MTTLTDNLWNATELLFVRSSVNVSPRLNVRAKVPSLAEGGSVGAAVVVVVAVALVAANVAFSAGGIM